MDEAAKLLDEIAQLGVTFGTENGQLRISAPKGVLTSDLQRRLKESKDEIVRRLQKTASADPAQLLDRLQPDREGESLPFPLSDLQLGFYIANDSYMEFHVRPHCYFEYDVGGLDPVAYEAAWNKALKRHRRELCTVTKDIELKLVSGDDTVRCRVYDLRNSTPEEVVCHLAKIREEMKRQELPLETWPWLDLRVTQWKENGREAARIHYNHNNFFIDGFGTVQFLQEIDEYYANPNLSYPPLTLSYRDAVLGLNRLAESESGAAAHRYWQSRLAGLPSPPALPQVPGFNRRRRSRLERREAVIDKRRWDAFKGSAAALGITPTNAMIAAYACVIATWSNSDHFILSQMATRRLGELHPDLPRMLGNFVSLYPLEIRLMPGASFADHAKGIQWQVIEDIKHLQIGGMRVLQELNHLKGSFGTAPSPFVVGSGLALKAYKRPSFTLLETSQTVLDYQFFELRDGGCHCVWDLQEEFFPGGVVDAMWEALKRLLNVLGSDNGAWQQDHFDLVSRGELVPRQERNRTEAPLCGSRLHDSLRAQASFRPDSPVLRSAHGALSYGELDAESSALAAQLRSQGVAKGGLVPIVADRGREALIAAFAILKVAAAYVPIDPAVPRERLQLLLTDIGARVALTQAKYAGVLAWPGGITVLAIPPGGFAEKADGEISITASDSDLAYVIYTSGSTGAPKGVMISHRGALNTVLDINRRFSVGPGDKLFGVSAFNFDLSVYDIFGAAAAGACLVYPNPESAQDPTHWLDVALRESITVWNSVPALMRLWVEVAEKRGVQVPSLRLVLLSGDKIPLDLPEAVRRVAPNAEVISLGGATEASIWSILYPVHEIEPSWATIPYGYPMVNQSWHVRDRHGRDCPTWVPGELCIGGVGLAQGYWRDPEKTSRSFITDAVTGERLYRTGDQGRYLPDGCIEWMGRIDFQVKVQGQRVELGEIEAVLAEHPAVAQAVVVLGESTERNEPRLVACIVAKQGEHVDGKRLEPFIEGKLPAYMVPRAWRVLDQLPLSENGKVDRKALRKTHGAADECLQRERRYAAPENAIEQRLQAIWEQTLGVPRIGVTDDFFELGGQSFDAIRMFSMIKEEFGRAHTLSDIWRARTIRELGKGLAQGADKKPGSSRVVLINLQGGGEPLFLVHPAGGSVIAYSQLGEVIDRPLYGIEAGPSAGSERAEIGSMAREYVSDVRRQQPRGPYSLGGWSSGAMIAFEMAVQLEAAGERVRHVFVLDGPTPVTHLHLKDETLLRWFLQDLALQLPAERLSGETFSGLEPQEQLRKAIAVLDANALLGPQIEALTESYLIFRDVIRAGSRYEPERISSPLTVVRVAEDVVDEFSTHPFRQESDWGWGRFTSGEVRCARVPGTHHTFLKRPLVERWRELVDTAEMATAGRA